MAARLAQMPPEQRAALERALLARRSVVDRVAPRDRSRPTRLSPSQRRLWFLDQLNPGAPTYNAVVAFVADGDLVVDDLVAVLTQIVERHEVLRTVVAVGGEPRQVVLPAAPLPVDRLDLRDRSEDERWDAALDHARAFCRAPYDLGRDLPLRLLVVQLADDRHLVVLGEHHIAFDGWSDEILFAELGEGYAARRAGRVWNPDPLEIQYGDVAEWWAERGVRDSALRYWQEALRGAPTHVVLPTDRPHPVVPSFEGAHLDVAARGVGPALRRLQEQCRATAYMVLSAAFGVAVSRWSGTSDLVLGTPMANRGRTEFEALIGFFSNTVPVRLAVAPTMTFREAVQTFRSADLGAMEHQDVPFDRIVDLTRVARDPRRNPLFQVNVRVQQGGPPLPDLVGLSIRPVAVDLGFSRFDLAIDLTAVDDDVVGYLEYSTQLFDPATPAQFARWFEELVDDALSRPDTPIEDLRFGPVRPSVRGGRRRIAEVSR